MIIEFLLTASSACYSHLYAEPGLNNANERAAVEGKILGYLFLKSKLSTHVMKLK